MKFEAFCLGVIFALSSSLALAGPVADAGEEAETLLSEGKTLEALDALSAAMDEICRESPLVFRDVTVMSEDEAETAEANYRPDEKMTVSAEVVCLQPGGSADSATIDLSADLAIENTSGQVLGEQKDLFKLSAPAQAGAREFSMRLTFGVPYLRPGQYKAVYTVRDQNSEKSGSFEVPFNVGLPAGAGEAAQ
jgi:hypothetical protein